MVTLGMSVIYINSLWYTVVLLHLNIRFDYLLFRLSVYVSGYYQAASAVI